MGFILLATIPAWAGQSALPVGGPNIFDPELRAQFQPLGVSNLLGDPEFPVLHVVNREDEKPQAMLTRPKHRAEAIHQHSLDRQWRP